MWNLKNDTGELIYETEIHPQVQKTNLGLPQGKGGRDKLEAWDEHMYTTGYKVINKDLLYHTENYSQYHVTVCKRKESENRYMYACITG